MAVIICRTPHPETAVRIAVSGCGIRVRKESQQEKDLAGFLTVSKN
jgi:hypothetical protein